MAGAEACLSGQRLLSSKGAEAGAAVVAVAVPVAVVGQLLSYVTCNLFQRPLAIVANFTLLWTGPDSLIPPHGLHNTECDIQHVETTLKTHEYVVQCGHRCMDVFTSQDVVIQFDQRCSG